MQIGFGSLLRNFSFKKFRISFEVFADLLDETFVFAFFFFLVVV